MSLSQTYRNADIIFENHTELEKFQNEFDAVCRALDDVADNINGRIKNGTITGDSRIFLRVAPSNAITIYISISLHNSPYLFLYNSISKEISTEIPFEYFRKIGQSPYIFMLEDAIKIQNADRYKLFDNDDVGKRIDELARKYDRDMEK